MKNRELFLRDPATTKLVNNGQARITDGVTPQEREVLQKELREELSNFVCEGQYQEGMLRVMESFLSQDRQSSNSCKRALLLQRQV